MPRLVLPLLVLALLAAGCGEKSEPDISKIPPPAKTTSPEGGGDGTLVITASGSGQELAFDVGEAPAAGVTEITLDNNSGQPTEGQLALVEGDHDEAEVLAELANARSGKAVAESFHAAGGPGSTPSGGSSTVTQVLSPGTYYVLPGDDPSPDAAASFTVEGEASGKLPGAEGRVTATEYSFAGQAKAGRSTLQLSNVGEEWHHFRAAQIKQGKSLDEVKAYLRDQSGESPLDPQHGVESTVMDGGVAQVVDADLPAGRYAFFCVVSDRAGGPPHIAKGMVSEIAVR